MSSPSEREETRCCNLSRSEQHEAGTSFTTHLLQREKSLTESGADEQFGHALWVVVLLVLEDLAGDHLLLHLLKQVRCQ